MSPRFSSPEGLRYCCHAGKRATVAEAFRPAMRRGLAIVLLLALAACNRAADAGKLTIAVIPKGTSHVFWQSIHAGANKAAQELGVTVVWRGPLREDERDAQVSEVE